MPDNSNRYVKNDLRAALEPAELRIARFPEQPNTSATVNIPELQRQFAQKSAQERTDALFDFLVRLIAQGSSDEINRQQILQKLTNLETRLAALEAGRVPTGT